MELEARLIRGSMAHAQHILRVGAMLAVIGICDGLQAAIRGTGARQHPGHLIDRSNPIW